MARIEVTAAIRRSADDVFNYLSDLRNHPAFLPSGDFRGFAFPEPPDRPARRLGLEFRAAGRWWRREVAIRDESPGTRLVHASGPPLPVQCTWQLTPLKADRRGPRTAVKLSVEYDPPGGPLGRILDSLLFRGRALKVCDRVIRALPVALEGPPRSGLRREAG